MARATPGFIALVLALTLTATVVWGDTASNATNRGEPVSRWPGRWYVASSAALGFDSTRLAAAISSIGRMRGVQGFLLVRNGYLVEEHYWRGGARDKPHNLKSASKSVISALVGIAIAKGYFRLDQPISDLLPQARILEDSVKRGITVYQLLTMTSGLESTSYQAYNDWVRNPDWITAALRRPLATLPGTEYRYSTGNTHMLSAILAASTGKSTREFAEQELFNPMGIDVAGWQKDPTGIHLGGNNFSLLPRDTAKFGQLYLDDGRWRNRQLVPRSWIEASTGATDNGTHETYGNYGFLWWTQPPADGSFAAVGYGGQYILVSPHHDSVVVVLSNVVSKGDRWEARLFELLKRGVLDSLTDPSMPPAILLGQVNAANGGQARGPVMAIAATNVNLREEPSLSARRLALIPEGSQLELLERDDEWVRGRINGKAGWLHWDYIDWFSLQYEELELTPVAIAKRGAKHDGISSKQPDVTTTNRWKIIDGATRERADRVSNSLETNDSIVDDDTTVVALRSRFDRVRAQVQDLQTLLTTTSSLPRYRTTARINFRRNPSLNGTWLRLIEPETEFQVLEHHGPWLKANIDGVEGWLHSDFVLAVASTPAVADHNDLAAELSAAAESVRQLLAKQRVSESETAAAKRSMEEMERELERTLERLQDVEFKRARLDQEQQAKAQELVSFGITQKQRAQELDTARAQIAKLEDVVQQEQASKQSLADELGQIRDRSDSQRQQLEQLGADQEQRTWEFDAARAQIAKLEDVVQQEQASKQGLADELGRIRDRSDAQRQQLEQLGADQEQRIREFDAARAQIAKLEDVVQQEQASKQGLADELGRIRDRSDAQRQQLEQLGADQEQRTWEFDAARAQIAKLEDVVQQEQASKQGLADELGRIRDRSDAQRQQLEQLGADQEQRIREFDAARAQIAKLEDVVQQEQASKQGLADELGRIRDRSDAQRQQLEQLGADQEQRTREFDAARAQIAKLEDVLQQEQVAKQGLAADLMRSNEERQTQNRQLEQLGADQEQRIREFDAARAQIAKLEGVVQQEQVAKQGLAGDLARLQDEHQIQRQQFERALREEQVSKRTLADKLARLDAGHQTLRQQLDEFAAAEQRRAEELKTARTRVIDIERTVQQQRAEKQTLADDLLHLSEAHRTQGQRLARFDAASKQDVAKLDAADAQISELEQALQQERTAKQTLAADLMRLNEERQTQSQRLDAASKQEVAKLDAADAQISELEQALQQERTAKQTLAADLMRLNEERQTQTQRLERLDAVHKQSTDELDAARTELAELAWLRSRVRELEDQGIRADSRDIAMSEELEHQSAGRPTVPEPLPKVSLAATTPPLKAESATIDVTADIDALVYAWGAAWSEQDVGAYLAFYSQEFRPPGGATRKAWETLRRHRLMRPAFIEVSIADLEITLSGLGRAQATFRQAYRADRYQDQVLKTLELILESDQWRIVRETSR